MTLIALRLRTVQLLRVKLTILYTMLLYDHTSILKEFCFPLQNCCVRGISFATTD